MLDMVAPTTVCLYFDTHISPSPSLISLIFSLFCTIMQFVSIVLPRPIVWEQVHHLDVFATMGTLEMDALVPMS